MEACAINISTEKTNHVRSADGLLGIFALGATVMYFYNLNWININEIRTQKIIDNSKKTYDLQRRITLNYSESFDQLLECFKFNPATCSPDETGKKFDSMGQERNSMVEELKVLEEEKVNILKR